MRFSAAGAASAAIRARIPALRRTTVEVVMTPAYSAAIETHLAFTPQEPIMTTRTDTIAHAVIAAASLAILAAGLADGRAHVPANTVQLDKVVVVAARTAPPVEHLPKMIIEARRVDMLATAPASAAPRG